MKDSYIPFLNSIKRFIPITRIFTDDLHTLAYGTDASFYRLIPQIVVKATDGTHEIELTPVYHLLAPEVSKSNEYKKQIIF